jgi:hypothetical protein
MFGWWPNSLRRDEALAALSGGLLPLPTFHRGREWQREVTKPPVEIRLLLGLPRARGNHCHAYQRSNR